MTRAPLTALALVLVACAHGPAARTAVVRGGTPDAVNVAAARARGARPLVAWSPWGREAFERARREGRYVLVDGAAAWCHWCHVMDATTYADPEVARRVSERFVAVRFDAEANPDLAGRYAEWGWPATVILSPDGAELEMRRGYLAPERMRALLDAVIARPPGGASRATEASPPTARRPLADGALATAGPWIARGLDDLYDAAQGSWGAPQKVAIGANVAFELLRAAHGDAAARARALYTLQRQRALYDPVWGGVYQYSAGATWDAPHFEKLMPFQAATIEALSLAYRVIGGDAHLADARAVAGYVTRFLRNADGAFLATQDADVNAHDDAAPFVDGHVYYARDDAGRRALGLPRVDPHVYARENGLAIAALASLHRAAPHPDALAAATGAAEVVARTHTLPDGAVFHESNRDPGAARYLADAAAFGRGCAVLAAALPEASAERQRLVVRTATIARAMLRDFDDPSSDALLGRTAGASGVGPLAAPTTPEEENITAARFLAALAGVTGDEAWRVRARAILGVMALPQHVEARGRFVGDLLVALDEAGLYPWAELRAGAFVAHDARAAFEARLDGAHLALELRAGAGFHVNEQYPTSLSLEARGAQVPAAVRRAEALSLDADAARFRVEVRGAGARTAVRGVLRYALCGAENCVPEERWFIVTAAPDEGVSRAPPAAPLAGRDHPPERARNAPEI